jgi:glycosyltransferase involved in cell wall biosynthesis
MADVFVMPSVSEPFGLSALEAARAGVPCVLSSRSGASEILHHALQIDPNSPEALSRQVEWLIDHPMEAREIVQQTLTDLGTVSWDQAAQEVLKVYRSVMELPVVASDVSAV